MLLWAGFGAGCAPDSGSARHLILVSVDTLRADHLGSYGHAGGLTPHLDDFARRSVRFARAYAPAPFTFPSVASLLSGRHPVQLGIQANLNRLPMGVTTLAQRLQERGFQTGAVVGNPVLSEDSGLSAGFDHYVSLPSSEHADAERASRATTDGAIEWLERADSAAPVFLWVHYLDPHGPYSPPEAWRAAHAARHADASDSVLQLSGSDSGVGGIPGYQYQHPHRDAAHYSAGYAGEVALIDAEFGRLLAALSERDLLAEAVLVFTADHGESLGEQDLWFDHGENLGDASMRVPLLFAAPGLPPEVRNDVVGLLDVVPTLATQFGLTLADERLPGADLLGTEASPPRAYLLATSLAASTRMRLAVVRGDYKFVRTRTGARDEYTDALFALPDESTDVARERPHVVQQMRGALKTLLAGERRVSEWRDPSPEQKEALRALGYLNE